VNGNNATIENSTLDDKVGWFTITQAPGASGLTVQNCTFNGGDNVELASFINSVAGYVKIINNKFLNTPAHTIHISNGVVSGNYISGGGSEPGAHPDAVNVYDTTGPVVVSNNFIDFTNGGEPQVTNAAVRISTDDGNTSNVLVTNNILLGGQYTVGASPTTIVWSNPGSTGTLGSVGTLSNINIANNYIGFGVYGAFTPMGSGVTLSNNTIFDYTNPIYSTNAWAAYVAKGVGTTHLIQSTGGAITGSATGSTTLYSGGFSIGMVGTANETVFVGGAGAQYMTGGSGANIFKYLAISDSIPSIMDGINNFDPAKDVIDLSAIDANLSSPGTQNFTFIGTAAFSGSGGQVRYVQDPAHNQTLVEADLVGDSTPDLEFRITGLLNLSAANFALTAAQSTTDMAAGAALYDPSIQSGTAIEHSYTNVQGRSYTSYQAISNSGYIVAEDLNFSSSSNELDLYGANLTITRGSGAETLKVGTGNFSLGYRSTETIQVGSAGAETFAFDPNFGSETIVGFAASGTTADTIQLATSSFSYLNSSMSQAQDLAAVLSHALSSSSGTTIRDTSGDSLALNGLAESTISANGSQFRFV